MHSRLQERPDRDAPAAVRRRKQPGETAAWRREQDRMVAQIADHAIAGGASRAGPGATDEQAIDAYIETMRRDLLAFAKRDR